MITNCQQIINSAFSEPNITTDKIAQAIWVLLYEYERNEVPAMEIVRNIFTCSIIQQFQDVGTDLSLEVIDNVLKRLMSVLDNITDQLDPIIGALPKKTATQDGIDIIEILETIANEEVPKIIKKMVDSSARSSFLFSHIILWLRNYSRSTKSMLAVSPSEQLPNAIADYEQQLVTGLHAERAPDRRQRGPKGQRRNPFNAIAGRPREVPRGGGRDRDGHEATNLLPMIGAGLIGAMQPTLQLADQAASTGNRDSAIACTSDSLDGTKSINDQRSLFRGSGRRSRSRRSIAWPSSSSRTRPPTPNTTSA
jgi:hypothetical protein